MADDLDKAIESVLNQTYKNYELIVMDGGSTDGTVDVIKKYEDRLAYWTSAPDDGPSDAINKALPHTTGELIGFLGADDSYEPYALECVAKACDEVEADLYYGNMRTVCGDEKEVKDLKKFDPEKLFVEGTQWLGAVCAFVKKELLVVNYQKKNDVLLTDYLFFLRLYVEGRKFAHIGDDRPITNFSIGGRTTSLRYRTIKDSEMVRRRIVEEYPHKGKEFEKYKKTLKKMFSIGVSEYYIDCLSDEKLHEIIHTVLDSELDYVLFGCGLFGKVCARLMIGGGIAPAFFVDNNESLWGRAVEGVRVESPDILETLEGKVLIVTPQFDYEKEILRQLKEIKAEERMEVVRFSNIAVAIHEMAGEDVLEEAWKQGKIS
ncbi:MAG: glycosyltransferase [Eubacterium sp.]|nr:glycosyltransferase [Eubacterium sp.]